MQKTRSRQTNAVVYTKDYMKPEEAMLTRSKTNRAKIRSNRRNYISQTQPKERGISAKRSQKKEQPKKEQRSQRKEQRSQKKEQNRLNEAKRRRQGEGGGGGARSYILCICPTPSLRVSG